MLHIFLFFPVRSHYVLEPAVTLCSDSCTLKSSCFRLYCRIWLLLYHVITQMLNLVKVFSKTLGVLSESIKLCLFHYSNVFLLNNNYSKQVNNVFLFNINMRFSFRITYMHKSSFSTIHIHIISIQHSH
jgi:hypothetical protein